MCSTLLKLILKPGQLRPATKVYTNQNIVGLHEFTCSPTQHFFKRCTLLNTNSVQYRFIQASQNLDSVFENKDEKALTVWSNVRALRASPIPALTLGLSGLLPFVAAPCYIISGGLYLPHIAFAQLAYGACILSFLGGVRWGFTIPEENPVRPDWVNLVYSILPPLIAWGGLLMSEPFSSLSVIGGLTFAAYCDMAMYGYPPWFKGLRFLLSFIAILSLWTTLTCKYILKTEEQPNTNSGK